MNQKPVDSLLTQLIEDWEGETVEFKQAGLDYSSDKIGRYFSALSNEANLRDQERAWLVFGVDDKTRKVVGSDYRENPEQLHSQKRQLAESTQPAVTVREIHVLDHADGRVILFEIPAAPCGIPVAWKGHFYARAGESLTALGTDKLDEIRNQTLASDWSSRIVSAASLEDLDPDALAKARANFEKKYANRFPNGEVAEWSDAVFLDKAKVTIDQQITNTALLLLGKAESSHHLLPHPAQMTWKLVGPEKAYEHFNPPFFLESSTLYQRIRNIQMRILPEDELVAVEISKYDQKVVLEALHNCIAHQDYARSGRVIVTESPARLTLENEGGFYDGEPVDYLTGERTPRRYRNPFLARAMTELGMIDTMGYGLHEMFVGQAQRFLPMNDYDLSDPNAVKLIIHGGIVDPAYSRALIQNTDLPLEQIFALDRVQKQLPIDEGMVKVLRKSGFIEGRKPSLHVSADIAAASQSEDSYMKARTMDNDFYRQLILDYLKKFGSASRIDIDGLLEGKFGDLVPEVQKANKVGNLLTSLRQAGKIENRGSSRKPQWALSKD